MPGPLPVVGSSLLQEMGPSLVGDRGAGRSLLERASLCEGGCPIRIARYEWEARGAATPARTVPALPPGIKLMLASFCRGPFYARF